MNDDDMVFKSNHAKSDQVNIEFLDYYLNLNMHLLEKGGNIERNYLTPEFIGNIEIPRLPPREVQDRLVEPISKLYDTLIDSADEKIQKLFDENRKAILEHKYPIVKHWNGTDLFKINDVTRFFRNLVKGNIDELGRCITNLKLESASTRYLLYYLYYSKQLFILNNYNYYEFDINEFHGHCFEFKLLSADDQIRIIQEITPRHNAMLELKKERKANESTLRELINNL